MLDKWYEAWQSAQERVVFLESEIRRLREENTKLHKVNAELQKIVDSEQCWRPEI